MKLLLTALVLSFSLNSRADKIPDFGIPIRDTDAIEKQIYDAVLKETGFPTLQEFRVDWAANFQCMKVEPSEMDPVSVGVCATSVHAFQVLGRVAIIKKQSGYDISILYIDVE